MTYNPALFTVTNTLSGSPSDATDPGATLTLVSNVGGVATFHYQDATPVSATLSNPLVLGDLVAVVPNSATNLYQVKEQLKLGSIVINGGAITGAVSANGVHINSFFGDVTGDGKVNGLDTLAANTVAVGAASGFSAYQLLDPAIIGDVAGDFSVDAGDVSTIDAFVVQLHPTQIPTPPAVVVSSPNSADPTLSLPAAKLTAGADGIVSVPVLLDHPHPEGSTGLTEAVLALNYDPTQLSVSAADITLGSLPELGTGWQISSIVDAVRGQIGIEMFSLTPITATHGGSLVNIAFHLVGTSHSSAGQPIAAVQLVSGATPNGMHYSTILADTQGALVVSDGIDQLVMQNPISAALPTNRAITVDTDAVETSNHPETATAPGERSFESVDAVALYVGSEATSFSALSNGAMSGDVATVRSSPASLTVTGMLAFQPNGQGSAVQQLSNQLVQIASALVSNLNAVNIVSPRTADRLFSASIHGPDNVADLNWLDPLSNSVDALIWDGLKQDWLANPSNQGTTSETQNSQVDASQGVQGSDQGDPDAVLERVFADLANESEDFNDIGGY